jgi:hypothetical protein
MDAPVRIGLIAALGATDVLDPHASDSVRPGVRWFMFEGAGQGIVHRQIRYASYLLVAFGLSAF